MLITSSIIHRIRKSKSLEIFAHKYCLVRVFPIFISFNKSSLNICLLRFSNFFALSCEEKNDDAFISNDWYLQCSCVCPIRSFIQQYFHEEYFQRWLQIIFFHKHYGASHDGLLLSCYFLKECLQNLSYGYILLFVLMFNIKDSILYLLFNHLVYFKTTKEIENQIYNILADVFFFACVSFN